MSETTLWTNPDTSSSFGATDVTLSESIQNYDFIKIYVAFGNATSGQLDIAWGVIMTVSDFLGVTVSGESGRQLFSPTEITQSGAFRYRNVYYKGDTTVGFSQCYESGTAKNQQLIPLRVAGVKKGGGSTENTIKSAIHDKVFNGGFNITYTLSDAGHSRASVNEGRVAIDTTNKCAYLYVDFTTTATTGSGGNWDTLKIDNFNSSYYPANKDGGATPMPLLTDDTSTTPSKRWVLRTDAVITNPKGGTPGYNSGDRFIAYGAWNY